MGLQTMYSLYGINGQRKYLTSNERARFFKVANEKEEEKKLFFLMLYYTGARISEVLNLQKDQLDYEEKVVVIECLKKRKKGIYRVVPLPFTFLKKLKKYSTKKNCALWSFSKRSATRYINAIMIEAKIYGLAACSKGLRHSFAVTAIENNIPLNVIKNWLGHSNISTTAIYLNVIGKEERQFAKRMW